MTLHSLDRSTIQSLHSGQVIVDIEAIVKELLENALDAHATCVDFVFVNNGLESIQLKDNGDGITLEDRAYVAKRHYTSKIRAFHDLESVQTYGFRGEALNSICAISHKFTIMTKTKSDLIAKQYSTDKQGNFTSENTSGNIPTSGTMITLDKPFYDLPVRRQLAIKQATVNMKKIAELLNKYALAHPHVRFSSQLTTDTARKGNTMWIKPVTTTLESTMAILFGSQYTDMLERFLETDLNHPTLSVDAILPKANSDPSVILKGPDRIYIYVNQRPINYVKSELKELVSMIRNRYRDALGLGEGTSKKTPFIYVHINIAPNEYDVNIEPNKTTILFHEKQLIYNLIENKVLNTLYPKETHLAHGPPQVTQMSDDVIPTQEERVFEWSFTMDDSEELDQLESDDEANPLINKDQVEKTNLPQKRVLDDTMLSLSILSPIASPTREDVSKPTSSSTHHQSISRLISSPTSRPIAQPTTTKRSIPVTEKTLPKEKSAPRMREEIPQDRLQSTLVIPPSKNSIELALPLNKAPPPRTPRRNPIKEIRNTLDHVMPLSCHLQEIQQNYSQRKQRLEETYRVRFQDYLADNHKRQAQPTTHLISFPVGSSSDPLSFYTRQHHDRVTMIGIARIKPLCIAATLERLIQSSALICKKSLSRPVQIHMDHGDPLCPILIGLKTKEQFVDDDMHGQKKLTYSEIIQDAVVDNGFKVRWRKDLYKGDLVIQFTGFYELTSGAYGPADFRELLKKIPEGKRPDKVIQHLKIEAERTYRMEDVNTQNVDQALKSLLWQQEKEWDIGTAHTQQVVAIQFNP